MIASAPERDKFTCGLDNLTSTHQIASPWRTELIQRSLGFPTTQAWRPIMYNKQTLGWASQLPFEAPISLHIGIGTSTSQEVYQQVLGAPLTLGFPSPPHSSESHQGISKSLFCILQLIIVFVLTYLPATTECSSERWSEDFAAEQPADFTIGTQEVSPNWTFNQTCEHWIHNLHRWSGYNLYCSVCLRS